MVNFNLLEILERSHKIQLEQEIRFDLQYDYKFRKHLSTNKSNSFDEKLPSNIEIAEIIRKAEHDAQSTTVKLGIFDRKWSPEKVFNNARIQKQQFRIFDLSESENEEDAEEVYEFQNLKFFDEKNGKILMFNTKLKLTFMLFIRFDLFENSRHRWKR
jgi:hypothetical protein